MKRIFKHPLSTFNSRKINMFITVTLLCFCTLTAFSGCTGTNNSSRSSIENNLAGVTVTFPSLSEPIQITGGDKEHFFASYYGINSWSASQRYVT
ncbi:MAG: hypothetical protein PHG06_20855, partial [Parabacteroides sp.]|nr:hypothetical protein [Parabacteroides sp.]